MASIYQKQEQTIQRIISPRVFIQDLIATNPEKFGAAISTSFATITMTAFLWSHIVSSLIYQTA